MFFGKVNKIYKYLARLTKAKTKKQQQINKMINEKGNIINNPTKIQRIIRDYNEQLHANKQPRKKCKNSYNIQLTKTESERYKKYLNKTIIKESLIKILY